MIGEHISCVYDFLIMDSFMGTFTWNIGAAVHDQGVGFWHGRPFDERNERSSYIDLSLYKDNKLIAKIFFEISIKKERIDYIAERCSPSSRQHWSGGSSLKWILAFLMDLTTNALQKYSMLRQRSRCFSRLS